MVEESAQHPWEVFGKRVKAAREGRGWKQRHLADRLSELGQRVDRSVVSRIEKGQKFVSIRDLFSFAVALDVSPVHLIVPLEDEEPVAVVPNREPEPAAIVRRWASGVQPLPGADPLRWLAQLPEQQQRALIAETVLIADDPAATADRLEGFLEGRYKQREENDGN